jgi:hypothetical protein
VLVLLHGEKTAAGKALLGGESGPAELGRIGKTFFSFLFETKFIFRI